MAYSKYGKGGLWANIHAKRKRGEAPAKPGDADYPKQDAWERAQAAYGMSIEEYLPMALKGYRVVKSNDRKGKTHKVIGPGGKVKYFGDPKMGEKSKSKYGKKAFWARHAKNIANNPFFKAYAQATWQDGGEAFEPHMMYNPETGEGIMAETYQQHLDLDERGYVHEDEMQRGGKVKYKPAKLQRLKKISDNIAQHPDDPRRFISVDDWDRDIREQYHNMRQWQNWVESLGEPSNYQFYQKYPTEEDFMRAHPEVYDERQLIGLQNGGGQFMKEYMRTAMARGGSPKFHKREQPQSMPLTGMEAEFIPASRENKVSKLISPTTKKDFSKALSGYVDRAGLNYGEDKQGRFISFDLMEPGRWTLSPKVYIKDLDPSTKEGKILSEYIKDKKVGDGYDIQDLEKGLPDIKRFIVSKAMEQPESFIDLNAYGKVYTPESIYDTISRKYGGGLPAYRGGSFLKQVGGFLAGSTGRNQVLEDILSNSPESTEYYNKIKDLDEVELAKEASKLVGEISRAGNVFNQEDIVNSKLRVLEKVQQLNNFKKTDFYKKYHEKGYFANGGQSPFMSLQNGGEREQLMEEYMRAADLYQAEKQRVEGLPTTLLGKAQEKAEQRIPARTYLGEGVTLYCSTHNCELMSDAGYTIPETFQYGTKTYSGGRKMPIIPGNIQFQSMAPKMGFIPVKPGEFQPGDIIQETEHMLEDYQGNPLGKSGRRIPVHNMIYAGKDETGQDVYYNSPGGYRDKYAKTPIHMYEGTGLQGFRYVGNVPKLEEQMRLAQEKLRGITPEEMTPRTISVMPERITSTRSPKEIQKQYISDQRSKIESDPDLSKRQRQKLLEELAKQEQNTMAPIPNIYASRKMGGGPFPTQPTMAEFFNFGYVPAGPIAFYQQGGVNLGPGGYGTMEEFEMLPDSAVGPGGYGTMGEFKMSSPEEQDRWINAAMKARGKVMTQEALDSRVGPGGYGTVGELEMYPDDAPGPGGYGTMGEFKMASPADQKKWMEWAKKQGEKRFGGSLPGGANQMPCFECGGHMQEGGMVNGEYYLQEGGDQDINYFDTEIVEEFQKGGQWIQKAFAKAKKKGTLGRCTGENFGGPSCPPGSKQYNMAKTLRGMAAKRKKKQVGGPIVADGMTPDDYIGQYTEVFTNSVKENTLKNLIKDTMQETAEENANLINYASMQPNIPIGQYGGYNPYAQASISAYQDRMDDLQRKRKDAFSGMYGSALDMYLGADPFVKRAETKFLNKAKNGYVTPTREEQDAYLKQARGYGLEEENTTNQITDQTSFDQYMNNWLQSYMKSMQPAQSSMSGQTFYNYPQNSRYRGAAPYGYFPSSWMGYNPNFTFLDEVDVQRRGAFGEWLTGAPKHVTYKFKTYYNPVTGKMEQKPVAEGEETGKVKVNETGPETRREAIEERREVLKDRRENLREERKQRRQQRREERRMTPFERQKDMSGEELAKIPQEKRWYNYLLENKYGGIPMAQPGMIVDNYGFKTTDVPFQYDPVFFDMMKPKNLITPTVQRSTIQDIPLPASFQQVEGNRVNVPEGPSSNPFLEEQEFEVKETYGAGFQNEDIANMILAGVDAASAIARNKEYMDMEEQMRRKTLADNAMLPMPANRIGSRGRWVQTGMGTGEMDIQNRTPIFQSGENYGMARYGKSMYRGGGIPQYFQQGGERPARYNYPTMEEYQKAYDDWNQRQEFLNDSIVEAMSLPGNTRAFIDPGLGSSANIGNMAYSNARAADLLGHFGAGIKQSPGSLAAQKAYYENRDKMVLSNEEVVNIAKTLGKGNNKRLSKYEWQTVDSPLYGEHFFNLEGTVTPLDADRIIAAYEREYGKPTGKSAVSSPKRILLDEMIQNRLKREYGGFQEGGTYELSQDEIDYIMANGGSITYID